MRSPAAEYPDEGGGLLAADLLKEAIQSCGHGCAGGGESNHVFHSTAPGVERSGRMCAVLKDAKVK